MLFSQKRGFLVKNAFVTLCVICLTLFIFSCSTDEPLPEPTLTPEPIVETTPTPEPELVIPNIEVTLNNFHTRYFDDNETKFDFTVTGDFDSYEIVYEPSGTADLALALDDNGLPYDVGRYNVIVNYTFGGKTYSFDPKIVVRVFERPLLVHQLRTAPGIPGQINWEEEELILVDEDKTIETDYYIVHLKAGHIYSSWLFPFINHIIDVVHDFTGLYLPDSGQKFNLYFPNYSSSSEAYENGWWPHVRHLPSGDINMEIHGHYVGTWSNPDPTSFPEFYFPARDLSELILHEYAHVLECAFFVKNPNISSAVHSEGFATFIQSYLFYRLYPSSTTGNITRVIPYRDLVNEELSMLFHNRLEYALSVDYFVAGVRVYTLGAVFYWYVYEEFGMDKLLEIFGILVNIPSGSRVAIVNDILGADIAETFPLWVDENIDRLPAYIY
ncbi:MAG: hypothetical protein FWD38_02440 [Oscillospiraceae bacterium]|nr:hypothetical protein [Oscillospiraceae bacterium]